MSVPTATAPIKDLALSSFPIGRVAVTGANGFVGKALVSCIAGTGYDVVSFVRGTEVPLVVSTKTKSIGNLSVTTAWLQYLQGVYAVVHLAARVHVTNEKVQNPLDAFREINVDATLHLAKKAALAGVRRFVFISSIGVNGAETFDTPFNVTDVAKPHSAYAVSKYEAELGLQALAADTGMEVVIIRPPLVYGPNAPGNFGSLMRWLRRGVPLPLGAIHNQRSLVALDNLVDLIVTCITHPAAANQTFLVSDGEDVSTTELLSRMGKAMGCPARLVPVPASLLKLAAAIVGKGDVAQRLCGSLQVDIEKTCRLLDWHPPVTLDEGLQRAAIQG